jgi:CDP-paratose 2-epimerase
MKYLVTGGCGFVGSNLASEVLRRSEELVILDNLSRLGSEQNLGWLQTLGEFLHYRFDIRDLNDVESVIKREKPDVVFHLAGQVAMTTSIENPQLDFETNTVGTHNLLESVRKYSPATVILYSSTNKVYGSLEQYTYREDATRYICEEFPYGFDETLSLDFQSPYGCSKGAADQFLLDYCRMFGVRTVVFRHSSMYGGHQFATYDQGWIGWFCQQALDKKMQRANKPFTISGSGKQVRDVLYATDIVKLYFLAAEKIEIVKGKAFNIGGGYRNSLSLLELFSLLEKMLNIRMEYERLPWRTSDQKIFVANIDAIKSSIGWEPGVTAETGIEATIAWLKESI